MKISELADQVRNIPLREVLERYGFEAKPEGTTLRAKSEHHNIVVTGSRWFDNKAGVGGAGAIDLVIHIANVLRQSSPQRKPSCATTPLPNWANCCANYARIKPATSPFTGCRYHEWAIPQYFPEWEIALRAVAALNNVELITALISFNCQLALVGLQLRILNGAVSLLTTRVENKALAAYVSEQTGASGNFQMTTAS